MRKLNSSLMRSKPRKHNFLHKHSRASGISSSEEVWSVVVWGRNKRPGPRSLQKFRTTDVLPNLISLTGVQT